MSIFFSYVSIALFTYLSQEKGKPFRRSYANYFKFFLLFFHITFYSFCQESVTEFPFYRTPYCTCHHTGTPFSHANACKLKGRKRQLLK